MIRDGIKIMIKEAQEMVRQVCDEYKIPVSEVCKGSRITLIAAQKFLTAEIKIFTGNTYITAIEFIKGFLKLKQIKSAPNPDLKIISKKLSTILTDLTKTLA